MTSARRSENAPRRSLAAKLAPLKNLQVWRFSLYYFFSFGAFVALALWLPHYLVGVYGFDIKTAGMIGAPIPFRPRFSARMVVSSLTGLMPARCYTGLLLSD